MGAVTNVALVAHSGLGADRMFDPTCSRDNVLERFYLLREAFCSNGIECRTADRYSSGEVDVLVFHDFINELGAVLRVVSGNPCARLIYIPNEPSFVAPLHDERILPVLPVDAVLTWNDRIAGHYPHVVKCNIGQPVIRVNEIPFVPFPERKLICSIFANKPSFESNTLYEERTRAVEFFAGQACGMDLYGVGWESSVNDFIIRSFRGRCENKKEILRRYKFSIAYENVKELPGLITEKIFDCFSAGTVPIYFGAPNVADYIPPSCFIDFRNFRDYAHLHEFLVNLSEKACQDYLDAARKFIVSPQYYAFTSARYVEVLTEQIERATNQAPISRSPVKIKWQLVKLILRYPAVIKELRRFRRFFFVLLFVWQ